MEGTGRRVAYDNFTTIDWIHDFSKERVRIRNLRTLSGPVGTLRKAFDACQAWILVFLVGAVTGILAAYIDVISEWASDMKEGYCKDGFYLNRKFCCWHVEGNERCHTWATWSDAFHAESALARWWAEYFMFVVFGTSFALASAILVRVYAPYVYAAGSGIPEVKTILGGFVIRKFLGGWTLLIKCIGLCLSVGSGLSLGKEGPLVHVACCVGNILPRIFEKYAKNEAKKREILSASSAAGVSVAFGAPIGGVLFSLEEVSYYFPYKTMWRSFFCAMVAAISLQLVNPFRTGKLVLFAVEYKRAWHGFELPFFVLLGVLGGLYGSFFIRMNIRIAAYRKNSWLKDWSISEVGVISLVTTLLSFTHPFLRVSSVELVANLFKECVENDTDFYGLCSDPSQALSSVVKYLILAAGMKIFFTTFTFGIRVPAGIFIPSMAIGACVGRALGIGMQLWQRAYPSMWMFTACKPHEQCVTPGTYAMVGAAAALGGVTRMTVSLTVIMFELTGALTYSEYLLPIMLTVMVSKWVGDALGTESIYDALIHLNGYPFLDSKTDYIWNTTAGSVMTRVEDLDVIVSSGCTIENLEELLQTTSFKGYPVVDSQETMGLIGYAGSAELRYALDQARRSGLPPTTPCTFSDTSVSALGLPGSFSLEEEQNPNYLDLGPWTDHTPMTISPRFPMEMVLELFKKMGLRYVIVYQDGRANGIITKKDLLRHVGIEKLGH
ncbi:chloride channel [Powellomyces hirtus]|nr:chloride channel [Powellomyces hirtus]